jgi:Mrp family chromosome partitioning ATPase
LRAVVRTLAETHDVVLVKAPPVLTAAAGLVACAVSDGVVVVTDEAAMNQDLLTEELRMFEVAGAPVLGVVAHA